MFWSRVNNPSWRAFVLGAGLSLLCTVLAALMVVRHARREESLSYPRRHRGLELQDGSWGTIDALRIPLLNPGGTIPDRAERFEEPQWFFATLSEERVAQFLKTCDLTPRETVWLLDRNRWTTTSNGCLVAPPAAVVRSLGREARAHIYRSLAKSRANYPQRHPFRFPTNGFERCLAAGGLSSNAITKLKRLTYLDGGNVCFTDLPTAKDLLPEKEFAKLVTVLYQVPTYRLRLRLTEASDVDALVRYWGRGGRTNLIRPLLTSLARVPEGASISVSCLLPPFPRLRLYTFPEWWDDPAVENQDCFYTALNFFSTEPNTNFFDPTYALKVLREDYAPVNGCAQYGDLIMFLDSSGNLFHLAVYVAGDFVFTKNGINPSQPWSVMKISDVLLLYYGADPPGDLTFVRRKETG